jgi:TPR repeat protein
MNYKHLVAALLILAASPPVAAQSVKAGIEAWQKADYAGAVAIWRTLAEKGDADAQFNLGQAYRLGRGVPTNLSVAQTWFERAANQGHLDAQATLGLLMFQSGDQAGGLRWLKAAALKGEPRALLVYGTALFNGDGVTQDPVMGYAFVSRAAAQGLAPAKETLAQMDKILPLADRKKGVAIAIANAKKTPAPKSHTVTMKPPKPAKPAQPTVASATPKPKPAQPAPVAAGPAPAKTGAWRIQLGAFSQRSSAEALFRKLSGNGALAGRQAFYIPVGAITRLQAGPFESRAAASSACSALKGQPCFVVAAK